MAAYSKIKEEKTWAELNNEDLQSLAKQLTSSIFKVTGKSTFKEEFVTAGGIDLKEINFKTFESKLHDNLFFAVKERVSPSISVSLAITSVLVSAIAHKQGIVSSHL